jgi:hypothetical protein
MRGNKGANSNADHTAHETVDEEQFDRSVMACVLYKEMFCWLL